MTVLMTPNVMAPTVAASRRSMSINCSRRSPIEYAILVKAPKGIGVTKLSIFRVVRNSPILRIAVAGVCAAASFGCDKLGLGGDSPTAPTPLAPGATINYSAVGASDANGVGSSVVCLPLVDCPNGMGYVPVAARQLRGRGFTVNLPMPAGLGDAEYARVYRQVVEPIGRAFDPQLLLVSVGFDPYVGDPLAGMRVTERGFAEMAAVCLSIAAGSAGSRAVFVLEGGYDLDGIARSAAAVVALLAGEAHAPLPWPASGPMDRLLEAYRQVLAPFWPALRS